jgi:hypothetical protein
VQQPLPKPRTAVQACRIRDKIIQLSNSKKLREISPTKQKQSSKVVSEDEETEYCKFDSQSTSAFKAQLRKKMMQKAYSNKAKNLEK